MHNGFRFARVVTLVFAIGGVGKDLEAQPLIVHPDAENLRPSKNEILVSRTFGGNPSPELTRYATILRSARIKDSIGTLDGEPGQVLGLIRDVSVSAKGEILVVDRANRSVRTFDLAGRQKYTIGRYGAGPSDLKTPISAWVNADNDIVVFDASLGTKYFRIDKADKIAFKRVIPITSAVSAACGNSRATALMMMPRSDNPDSARIVRTFDSVGRAKLAFGAAYRSATPLVRSVMSEGQIGCLGSGDVFVALVKLPTVSGFSAQGTKRFTVRFQDFTVGRHLEQRIGEGRSSIGLDPSKPTASTILQIREVFAGFVIVQIGLMTPQSLKDRTIWSRIDTYLVDAKDGSTLFVSSTLPLLGGVVDSSLVAFANDPFPRVLVYSLK